MDIIQGETLALLHAIQRMAELQTEHAIFKGG